MEGSGPRSWCSCCSKALGCWLRLKLTEEELDQRYRSREIDRGLERDRQSFRRQVRLLLLGAGESGKSTFLKQMRIIHKVKFEPELLKEYQHIIYQNVVKGIQVLVDARDKLAIPWEYPRNLDVGLQALRFDCTERTLDKPKFMHYAPHIHSLWQDRAIKRAYERRREFQLSDSVRYFLDELERISRADYVPSHQDILHCRKATKGISECRININNVPFVFVDVGGQRTQRQKWTQCFDSVTSILFLVSSSEFDQVLSEDRKTNRLQEAKEIFDSIVNHVNFKEVSIILFLNKSDLLARKLANPATDFRQYYPEYTGDPRSLEGVQKFILTMFENVRREPKKQLYHHFTTAVDTRNINVVFNSVKDTILNRNLHSLMLQ